MAYCLATVVGGEPRTVVNAMVALLISVPLYPFFIRSMEAAKRAKRNSRGGLSARPHMTRAGWKPAPTTASAATP